MMLEITDTTTLIWWQSSWEQLQVLCKHQPGRHKDTCNPWTHVHPFELVTLLWNSHFQYVYCGECGFPAHFAFSCKCILCTVHSHIGLIWPDGLGLPQFSCNTILVPVWPYYYTVQHLKLFDMHCTHFSGREFIGPAVGGAIVQGGGFRLMTFVSTKNIKFPNTSKCDYHIKMLYPTDI